MDLRAVIFMPALVGGVVFGFVFLLYLSHYYLTILEGTATGAKEVTWQAESILDHFWKFWYMLWLFGLWLGPGYLVARAIAGSGSAEWLSLGLPIAILWLLYPVSQLSSLSASTIWLPLTPDVFARLAQKPAVTLGFYALSIPVLMLCALGVKWAFLTKGEWELLVLGVPLLILALFLYARLIGRLAFVLAFTKSLLEPRKKKPKPESKKPTEREADVTPAITQPRDLPPIQTVEGELTGYDVHFDDTPKPRKRVIAEVIENEAPILPPPLPSATKPLPPPLPVASADSVSRRSRLPIGDDEDDAREATYDLHDVEVIPRETTPRALVEPHKDEVRLLSRWNLIKTRCGSSAAMTSRNSRSPRGDRNCWFS
jgi:hypothetical protein